MAMNMIGEVQLQQAVKRYERARTTVLKKLYSGLRSA